MSLFDKRYNVKDKDGKKHSLTAKKLCEQVLAHNWIISIAELVRVCSEPDFPEDCAQIIKIEILRYATDFENTRAPRDSLDIEDNHAVSICYNSLADALEKDAVIARYNYLFAIIKSVTKWHFRPMEFNHCHGRSYQSICEKWKRVKFDKYRTKTEVDFDKLRERLNMSFDRVMRAAEAKGLFDAEDQAQKERKYVFESEFYWDEI